jgi:hypothetical protein
VTAAGKEAVRKVIQDHGPEIRKCYEARLREDPRLRGKVAIRWIVRSDGSVLGAGVEDHLTTLRDQVLHACMVSRIETWTFAPPAGGGVLVITYPWIFDAKPAAATEPSVEP